MDAAHFVHGAFLGSVWAPARLFVPSPSGRQRFNVLGAINPIGEQIITVEEDKYINTESVILIMRKIRNSEDITKEIIIFLDNVSYQRNQRVKDEAKKLNIKLKFLPTYSPNLNLIERLWKFVKNEFLYSIYYEKYKDFKSALSNGINNCYKEHKNSLKSLLSFKFQSFRKVNISSF